MRFDCRSKYILIHMKRRNDWPKQKKNVIYAKLFIIIGICQNMRTKCNVRKNHIFENLLLFEQLNCSKAIFVVHFSVTLISSTLKLVIIWILITWSWYGAIQNYNVKSNKVTPSKCSIVCLMDMRNAHPIPKFSQMPNTLESNTLYSLSTKQQMFRTEPNIFWRRDD